MPQIKSQKKRVKTNNKAHKLIVSQKSALKTSIKKVLFAVDAKDKEAALKAYAECESSWTRPLPRASSTRTIPAVRKPVLPEPSTLSKGRTDRI